MKMCYIYTHLLSSKEKFCYEICRKIISVRKNPKCGNPDMERQTHVLS